MTSHNGAQQFGPWLSAKHPRHGLPETINHSPEGSQGLVQPQNHQSLVHLGRSSGGDGSPNTHNREYGEGGLSHGQKKDSVPRRRGQREPSPAERIKTSENSTLGVSKSDQERKVVEGFPSPIFDVHMRSKARSKEVLVSEHTLQGGKSNNSIGAQTPTPIEKELEMDSCPIASRKRRACGKDIMDQDLTKTCPMKRLTQEVKSLAPSKFSMNGKFESVGSGSLVQDTKPAEVVGHPHRTP